MKKILYLSAVVILGMIFLNSCQKTNQDDPTPPDIPVVKDNTVTLYFETYGGEEIAPITEIEPGTVITLPTPEREGYVFDYWYTTKDLEFNTDLRKTVVVKETMTVYAGWFALYYDINFISNCGIQVSKLEALTDQEITLPILERENYDFLGWYEGDSLYNRTTMEPRNITLTAKWALKGNEVILDANGGIIPEKYVKQLLENNETAKLPNPEKPGYVFQGWFNNDTLITELTPITSDMTLVAKYEVGSHYSNTYSITYNTNGGELHNPTTKYLVKTETILDTPIKEGYTFVGWYTNPEFIGISYDKINISEYGNKIYYAKWILEDTEYTVTFIDSKGNIVSEQIVKYGENVEKIKFSEESYIEYSWFLNNRIFDFNTEITSDMTLVAKWTILENILDDLLPNQATEDLTLPKTINTSIGEINVVWSSDDVNTISIRGLINPLHYDKEVTLKAIFSIDKESYTHEAKVLVPGIKMRDLSETTPVFAYLSSNMSGFNGLEGIPEQTIDVVNYCFARVTNNGTIHLGELLKISEVLTVRKSGIRVVFSIGAYGNGETGCGNISRAASTPEGRKKLITSIIETVTKYHLDGIDMDWEYPGSWPASGITSEQDKANYTIFMQELRNALDELGPGYLLTAAVPGGNGAHSRYNLEVLSEVLDYLHLMTYDLHSGYRASHHTALYNSEHTPYGGAASAAKQYMEAGFPKEKIVIGAAFYGRLYVLSSMNGDPLGATNVVTGGKSVSYTSINSDYANRPTIKRGWDPVAQAPYMYDPATKEFISYDNPRSIALKCTHILENGYGGIMFWDYGQDITGTMVNAIYETLKLNQNA